MNQSLDLEFRILSEEFERLISVLSEDFSLESDTQLFVPLVMSGIKPGSSTFVKNRSVNEVSELFEDVGLHYKIERRDTTDISGCYVIYTDNPSLLKPVNPSKEDGAYGTFLGVPDVDNRWYKEQKTPEIPEVTPIPEYLDLKPPALEDLKYARLVPWICRPTEERLKATIDIGKRWNQFAERLDDRFGYEMALEYVNHRVSFKGSWYTFGEDMY
jgi:hypothetical protein